VGEHVNTDTPVADWREIEVLCEVELTVAVTEAD